ncbi:MAG: hypothetical protein QFX33_04275 [Candidatus Nezhaarchaeota archaeon]|nr:hypothetical protein [Candidatus Nezhaarchaeota archaeon]
MSTPRDAAERPWILPLSLSVGLLVRLMLASSGIHGTDILYHVAGAQALLRGEALYRDVSYVYPPLYAVLQALAIAALGSNVISYKLWPMLFDVAVALLLYRVVGELKSHSAGVYASALYFLNPLTIIASAWYGLFDSIPAFMLLYSLHLFMRRRAAASSVALGLGVVAKVIPGFAAPLLAARAHLAGGLRRTLAFLVVLSATIMAFELPFLVAAGEYAFMQLEFHGVRSGEGLSIMRFTFDDSPYAIAVSWAARMLIYGITVYAVVSRGRYGAVHNEELFEEALVITASTVTFNTFLYPHYLINVLPLVLAAYPEEVHVAIIEVARALLRRSRRTRLSREALLILAFVITISLACPAYWKLYGDAAFTFTISALYNATAIPLIILGVVKLMRAGLR